MWNETATGRRFRRIQIALTAVALTGFAGQRVRATDPEENPAGPARQTVLATDLEKLSEAMHDVFERVKPSVVNIRATSIDRALYRELRRLPADADISPMPTTGTGSGVIFDREGHIVTNNHVVADAESVHVTLADGRKYKATVIGTDMMTDLAVIQINAQNLVPAKFGDSDQVRVGHLVLAIGSPFRLGHSLSHGIISATGRSEGIDVEIDYKNWIQTDAPINPGNSGGPLINTRGEVVGINVAIATETGGHQGVGFAIPARAVTSVAKVLCKGEKVVRGYLGVVIAAVDDAVAGAYGLDRPGGVLIEQVGDDSPASKSDLRADDIVLAINGKPIKTRDDLQECVAATEPGASLELTVWRDQANSKVKVTIGKQPDGFTTNAFNRSRLDPRHHSDPESATEKQSMTTGRFGDLGFDAQDLTPELSKRFGIGGNVKQGIVITEVDPAGEAFSANLRAGQIILKANNHNLKRVEDLQRALTAEAITTGVRLRVRREGGKDATEFNTILRVR